MTSLVAKYERSSGEHCLGLERTSVYNMQSPHLPTLLAIHYFASLLPDNPIRREDADAFIDSATRELNSNVTADLALRGDTYSQSQIASLARLVSSCSNGKLDVTFCSNLTEGIDLAYNNIKSKKQTDESRIPVFTFVIQVDIDNYTLHSNISPF